MRRNIIIITIIICILGGGGFYLYYKGYFSFMNPPKSSFFAVPLTSSFIFETANFNDVDQFFNDVDYSDLKTEFPIFRILSQNKSQIESVFGKILNVPALIAAHFLNAREFDYIYFFNFTQRLDADPLLETVNELQQSGGFDIQQDFYKEISYHSITKKGDSNTLYCSFIKGMLIISPSKKLLSDALDQSQRQVNLENDKIFKEVKKLAGKKWDVTVYINFQTVSYVLSSLLKPQFKGSLKFFKEFANWCELDASFDKSKINFSGYSLYDDSLNYFLKGLQAQKPVPLTIDKIMPNNTVSFIWAGIENYPLFFESYLTNDSITPSYIETQIVPQIGKEIAVIYTDEFNRVTKTGLIAALEQKEKNSLSAPLKFISTLVDSAFYDKYPIYSTSEKTVKEFIPGRKVLEHLFFELFDDIKPKFWTKLNEYILFANDLPALRNVLFKYENSELLTKDIDYLKFSENMSSESNLVMYVNAGIGNKIVKEFFDEDLYQKYPKMSEIIGKFTNIGFELTNMKDKFYTNLSVSYDASRKTANNLLEKELAITSPVLVGPFVARNHIDQSNEIIYQDEDLVLRLMDMDGKSIWDRKLNEKIESDILQIDIFGNDKLQYIFNTKTALHIIDRKGRYIPNSPAKLPAPAASPMNLVQYEDGNTRIFITCENGNVYGYSNTGALLQGWNPLKVNGKIKQPAQYFNVGKTDYILVQSVEGTVWMLNRKGESRLGPINLQTRFDNPFYMQESDSALHWVSSDTAGFIFKLDEKGRHFQKALNVWPTGYYYLLEDLDGDNKSDHIYCTSTEVTAYSNDTTTLFKFVFPDEVNPKAVIFRNPVDHSKYLFFTSIKSNKLYAINGAGSLLNNFPIKGSTTPQIIQDKNNNITLVTSDKYNSIFLYSL